MTLARLPLLTLLAACSSELKPDDTGPDTSVYSDADTDTDTDTDTDADTDTDTDADSDADTDTDTDTDTSGDVDGDGVPTGSDCDDTDPAVGAPTDWHQDGDGDGYGSPKGFTVTACDQPDGYVANGDDCDDADPAVGASTTLYADADADGWGDDSTALESCTPVDGYVAEGGDCADADATINPGALEYCDGIDQDCDGSIDEDAVDADTWYADADGDGYGDAAAALAACEEPAGYVTNDEDCDDADSIVNPDGIEVTPGGVDDDCDGRIDEERVGDASGWTIIGSESNDDLGGDGVLSVSDLDGDGWDELVVTSSVSDLAASSAGAVGLYDYPIASPDFPFESGWLVVTGAASGDGFGSFVLDVGDPNLDGYGQLLVGAPLADPFGDDEGVVYVLDVWSDGSVVGGEAPVGAVYDAVLVAESGDSHFGTSAAVGDLDGDGESDLVVGAPGGESEAGVLWVYSDATGWSADILGVGDASASVLGAASGDELGSSILLADLDGDGEDDGMLCGAGVDHGADTEVGGCYFVTGYDLLRASSSSVDAIDTANFLSAASDNRLGDNARAIATGDLDGDGTADVAVGAPGYDGDGVDDGAVMVTYGGALSGRYWLESADLFVTGDGALGTAVTVVGDVDGDGADDLALGAPDGSIGGAVYVVLGGGTGTLALPGGEWREWLGDDLGDDLGTTVSVAGDLDTDGVLDLGLGASGADSNGTDAGEVYVVPID